MINKFKKDLREVSDKELMFFNAIKFLLFIRVCVYLASFFVKFEDRFIIDFTEKHKKKAPAFMRGDEFLIN